MDTFFKISEHNSSVGNEVIGGLTTFLAMSYIIAVNPQMLVAAGMPFEAALTATCIGAAIMTIAMGLIANRPVALASGMGINAIVAYTLCLGGVNVDWRVAMAIVMLEGVVIFILVACGLRKAVMDAIPASLRHAIGIGIGLFIAFIGLKGGGVIVSSESTLLTLGDLSSPVAIVSLVAIAIAVILQVLNVKGGLLISIVAATIVGIPLGVTPLPTSWNFGLDFSALAAPFQTIPGTDTMAIVQVFLQPALLLFVFSLLMSDFFDTMGTMVAVGAEGDLLDKDGNPPKTRQILVIDSLAAVAGGVGGVSSNTSYVESASGVAEGARTGLASVVTGVLFLLSTFLAPLVELVPTEAASTALVFVGYLMMTQVLEIDWKDPEVAIPAFMTVAFMPFGYSVSVGIGVGFVTYTVIQLVVGKARKVHPLMWLVSGLFVIYFLMGPIQRLLGAA